jgi:hypothetical protein
VNPFDAYFPLKPINFLGNLLSSWDFFGESFGVFSFSHISLSPLFTLPALLQLSGLQIELVNRVVFIFLTFGSSLTMYFLARKGPTKSSRLGGAFAGIYYALGPYLAGEIWLGHWLSMFTYLAAPIILLSISELFESSNWTAWGVILGITSPLILPRLRFLSYFAFTCLALVLFLAITKRNSIGHFVRGVIVASTVAILANLYYILPAYSNSTGLVVPLVNDYAKIPVNVPSTFDKPLNVLGLVGYGAHPDIWGQFLVSPLMSFVFVTFLSIIIYTSVRGKRYFDFLLLASGLALLAHMLLFSFSPVYNSWFVSLSNTIPFPINLFVFQRDLAYASWPVALAYALLAASAITFFSKKRKFWSILGQLAIVVIIIAISSSLLVPLARDPLRPMEVPPQYQEASQWISKQNLDFTVADISGGGGYVTYSWNPTQLPTTDIIRQMMPVPVIGLSADDHDSESPILKSACFPSDELEQQKAFEILGIKYLISRSDLVDSPSFDVPDLASLNSSFRSGSIEFLQTDRHAPLLFATTGYYLVLGGDDFLKVASKLPMLNFSNSAFAFVEESQLNEMSAKDFQRLIVVTNVSQIAHFQDLNFSGRQVVYLFDGVPFYGSLGLPSNYVVSAFDSNGQKHFLATDKDPRIADVQNVSNIQAIYQSDFSDSVTLQSNSQYGSQIDVKLSETVGFHGFFVYPEKNAWNFTSLNATKGGIVLQVFGDGSGSELRVSLQNPNPKNRYQWPLQTIFLDWIGWKTLVFPISDSIQVGEPSLESVSSIAIWVDNSNKTASFFALRGLAKYTGPMAVVAAPANINLFDFFSDTSVAIDHTSSLNPRIRINLKEPAPALLVLNTAYDSGWRAESPEGTLEHLVVDGYSNGFLINSSTLKSIDLTYVPQNSYELGLVLSASTILLAVLFLFFSKTHFIIELKEWISRDASSK